MTFLIFLLPFTILIVLLVRVIIKLIKRKPTHRLFTCNNSFLLLLKPDLRKVHHTEAPFLNEI